MSNRNSKLEAILGEWACTDTANEQEVMITPDMVLYTSISELVEFGNDFKETKDGAVSANNPYYIKDIKFDSIVFGQRTKGDKWEKVFKRVIQLD